MSYTVIARRWRPKKFEDVIGQQHIVTTLKNSIRSGRIPHAYLFTGPRGVGKTSLARILSKAVNCVHGPTEEPCDVCEHCVAINAGGFVDVIEIDAASARGIDDIKELRETVRYMPMQGRYKVYILDEAHMLTTEARNAFLKTLEEPPGHNIFILATTELQKIPYTIMSRCQRYDFRRIPEKEITAQLKMVCDQDGIGYDEGVFHHIALEADGSLRDAESILEQIIAYSGSHIAEKDVINIIGIVEGEILHGIVKSILDEDIRTGLEIIEKTLNDGYDANQIYKGLLSYLRNMMIIKVCDGAPPFLYLDNGQVKRLMELIGDRAYYEIQNMLHYLLQSENLLRGPFPKVSLEAIYINLYNISKLRDVEKILDGLESDTAVRAPAAKRPEAAAPAPRAPITAPVQTVKYDSVDVPDAPAAKPVNDIPAAAPGKEIPEEKPAGPSPVAGGFSKQGFAEFLKKKKPFVGGIIENLDTDLDGDTVIVHLDKKYGAFVKGELDEVKRLLKEYGGSGMDIVLREVDENKQNVLDDYVKEAETLFNF